MSNEVSWISVKSECGICNPPSSTSQSKQIKTKLEGSLTNLVVNIPVYYTVYSTQCRVTIAIVAIYNNCIDKSPT